MQVLLKMEISRLIDTVLNSLAEELCTIKKPKNKEKCLPGFLLT